VSQVNLLPPEILQGQRWRRLAALVAVLGGVAIVAVIGFYLYQQNQLSSVDGEIETQATTNAGIQTQINQKQKFADLQSEAQEKEALVATAYSGEVSFSALLMDVSRVMPSDAYVDSLTTSVTPPATTTAAAGTTPTQLVGTLSGTGKALSIDTVAALLTRLGQVDGWVNPWVSTLVRADDGTGYTYAVSVDLTDAVVTARGKEAGVAAG
jgi:Tfp pilus assembly protein PilN